MERNGPAWGTSRDTKEARFIIRSGNTRRGLNIHDGLSGPVRDQALKERWPFGPGGETGLAAWEGQGGKEVGGVLGHTKELGGG